MYTVPYGKGTIRFSLPEAGHVTLKVYNVLGDEVATLVNETIRVGVHQVEWTADNVPSGVYLYRLTTGASTVTRRMTLIK